MIKCSQSPTAPCEDPIAETATYKSKTRDHPICKGALGYHSSPGDTVPIDVPCGKRTLEAILDNDEQPVVLQIVLGSANTRLD